MLRPLREHFRPEFLNRIDEIVDLPPAHRRAAAADHRHAAGARPGAGCTPRTSPSSSPPQAVDWLARRGYQPEYGARPLRRTIQREVDNRLSRLLLDGRLAAGSRVAVEVEDGAARLPDDGRRRDPDRPVSRGDHATGATLLRGVHDHRRAAARAVPSPRPRASVPFGSALDAGRRADLRVLPEGVADRLQLGPQRAVPQPRFELGRRLVALAGARRGDRVDQRQAAVQDGRSGSAARW